ncbi:MAG: zinc ABC transporter permease [Gammaproteobacteria bacterium]|nr:zinc ABC transporter permease [Gammaproteobacteria bacterium]MBJ55431.1 zinc ABC transporter permease [Gammaproteobacteria bacterium]HBN13720.1 zinc ABC transporter permease subunit ZnuB [Pseudohongiella sp.]|tara:strand:- start:840 stop:1628 length:789 start_codon:yes stop_codon:yes gene_type:complete
MYDFIIYAVIAGLLIAALAGPLGCFVVWRRMSYFGDTLAHSSLLGVALAIVASINLQLAIIISCAVFAAILLLLEKRQMLATDTLLGIIAHSTLAFGLLILSLSDMVQVNLMAFLFGDLLTITQQDLIWIVATCVVLAGLLYHFWGEFLALTVHKELAIVEGLPVERLYALLVLMIAMLIAVAMKIVGVLLITSLLIIPAAAARRLASTPEQMALGAAVIGCLAVAGGVTLSFYLDTPAGPSIVACACVCFLLIYARPVTRA